MLASGKHNLTHLLPAQEVAPFACFLCVPSRVSISLSKPGYDSPASRLQGLILSSMQGDVRRPQFAVGKGTQDLYTWEDARRLDDPVFQNRFGEPSQQFREVTEKASSVHVQVSARG